MQNKHGFFGGLVVVLGLGLGACGAPDGSADGQNGEAEADGVHRLRQKELVGTWRSDVGAASDYSEWLELHPRGTARLTRRRDDTAQARAWVAEYQCEWSLSGPERATRAEPLLLVLDCELRPNAASARGDLGFARSFVEVFPVSAITPSGFVAEAPNGSPRSYSNVGNIAR
jgi:hypothetical protein